MFSIDLSEGSRGRRYLQYPLLSFCSLVVLWIKSSFCLADKVCYFSLSYFSSLSRRIAEKPSFFSLSHTADTSSYVCTTCREANCGRNAASDLLFFSWFFLFYRLLLYPRVRGWKESQSYIIFDDVDWMLFWKATLFTYNLRLSSNEVRHIYEVGLPQDRIAQNTPQRYDWC